MDCRKAIEKLQISVQQLTSQLEKCQKNASMDGQKISKLESKVDELSSSLLTFSFRISTAMEYAHAVQKSEVFDSPAIPYQFQINALWQNEELIICVQLLPRTNVQSHKKISLEVFLINKLGEKVSKEKTVDQNSKNFDSETISFTNSIKLFPISKWVINGHLHMFLRINRLEPIKPS